MKKLLLLPFVVIAWNLASSQSTLKTTQVNVFKNGTYFILKEGTVYPKNAKVSLEIPEQPLLGTYWINTVKDVNISRITYKTDTIKKLMPAEDIPDIVFANKGKKIKIGYKTDDKTYREASGLLQDYFKSSGMLKIKTTDGKTLYILISNVIDFSVDDIPADKMQGDSLIRLAKIEFSKSIDNTPIKLMYMQSGIQWIPSYNVKLISDKELQLEMKALVENNAEEINDADLTLTVGNPQFFYGTTIDPIAQMYQTNISSIYTTKPVVSAYAGNVVTQTNAYQTYNANDNNIPAATPSFSYNDYSNYSTEGEKTNDLYMYKIGKVSLAKNIKTSFQIFSYNLPYKDVYEANIADVVNYSINTYVGNDPEQKFEVYHSLKLTNTSANPFTTAPVFVMNENLQPLAQDQLKYTPVSSDVSIQLSRAPDVIIKNKEEEIKKTDETEKFGKETYSKVILKGSIIVENMQDKKIILSLNKTLTAEVTDVSDSGKIKKTGKYYGLNPSTEIKWEVPFSAKEKKTITYTYEVWIRSK
ncbi:MAG: hypothetical protein ABR968_01630 [Bacteroidales bacterium]|jgi:hypothetical protein